MRNSKYTKEFRDKTVQLILNIEKSAMQITKDLEEMMKLKNNLNPHNKNYLQS